MIASKHFDVLKGLKKTCLSGLVIVLAGLPTKAPAIELGLTPSHVYGLWTNIHLVMDALQKDVFNSPLKPQDMNASTFKGKTPTQVYATAIGVQAQLAQLFDLETSTKMPLWIAEYGNLQRQYKNADITPSQVYVLSSQILNALVETYVSKTQGTLPISTFYEARYVVLKTPSDVYGLVELFARRLDDFPLKPEGQ